MGLLLGQTSEQIKKAKEVIQQRGISESQARAAAKAQGYTDQQINSVIQKEKSSKSQISKSATESVENISLPELGNSNKVFQEKSMFENMELNVDEKLPVSDENDLEVVEESKLDIESQTQPGRQGLTYFGYKIFQQDPELFQAASVGIVDPGYLIGPGDEIITMLWGETQFRQLLTVDREGFVFIPEIGQVFVNGLSLDLLESKLFRVFSQSYASLNPQGRAPTTFLDVSLGNLRPLRIQVLGEVAQPGAYTVSPSATLFSALYYFNGPTTLGSLRDIQLIRGGEKIASIDFYNYLLTGEKPKDQKLQLDDVIFIPSRLNAVSIQGEINRSGIYELRPEESLADLISIAGNLKITAYMDRAQIDRIIPFEERKEFGMDRMYTDVNLGQILKSKDEFSLQDGDRIQIFSILDLRQNVVGLRGAVTRPGSYDIGDSLKLSELINKADGLLGDAFLDRVDVVRIKPDFTEELIKLDLRKALEGSPDNNINLQSLDRVQVYSITEMVPRTYASITGHVKSPGRYLIQENMTLYDLIFKAGGFLDEDFRKQTFLERADLIRLNDDNVTRSIKTFNLRELLDSPESGLDLPLQSNDLVRIYDKNIFINNKTISINGVVRSPGSYILKTDMSLKDLILEAGGLNENVYRYRVEVARIDPLNDDLDEYAEVVTFNMDEKFSILSPIANNFTLNPYDLITIRPDPYFINQKQVDISGAILYPGKYTILSSDEKITDIIRRSGGLLPNAYSFGSSFSRNGQRVQLNIKKIIKSPKSDLNIVVQSGDLINIALKPQIIQVIGEVNVPGFYKFQVRKRISDIIKNSGGFTQNAEKDNIYIQYPDGTSSKYHRWFNNKKVLDGSIITVGKKREEEPFDKTDFAKELTSILANLAQTISIIVLAYR
tara:strand:- start:2561 stop:5239 length:2679 start_codon:yes stop_codon:yes gene_type:complete